VNAVGFGKQRSLDVYLFNSGGNPKRGMQMWDGEVVKGCQLAESRVVEVKANASDSKQYRCISILMGGCMRDLISFMLLMAIATVQFGTRGYGQTSPKLAGTSSIGTAGRLSVSEALTTSGKDFSGESQYTGDVSFSVPLTKVGAVPVQLQYNSNVNKQLTADSNLAPTGWIGLGWSLNVGSIVGEISNTPDVDDDKYFYVDADGSSEIMQPDSGVFEPQNYKAWKITCNRTSAGYVKGWTIVREDGTIMRFGNYDRDSADFVLSRYEPTYATRCYLGFGDWVSNPAPSQYSSAKYVPFQWDLSDVQDPAGNHTTIVYQQVQKRLRLGNDSTSKAYTRESHVLSIQDNSGGEAAFVLGQMNSCEYYSDYPTYTQNHYETKYLQEVQIKLNGQTFQRIVFGDTLRDVLNIGLKKRYVMSLQVRNASGQALPRTAFEYAGHDGDRMATNPGALQGISYPSGGRAKYEYVAQRLDSAKLDYQTRVYQENGLQANLGYLGKTGMCGKDFIAFMTRTTCLTDNQGGDGYSSLRVLRWGTKGWFVDSVFRAACNNQSDSAVQFVAGYDYLYVNALSSDMLLRRTPNGWRGNLDIDGRLQAAGGTVGTGAYAIGQGPNFIVMKHNSRDVQNRGRLFDISVIRLLPWGIKIDTVGKDFEELDHYHNIEHHFCLLKADCGSNYFVVTSHNPNGDGFLDSHYKLSAGVWRKMRYKQLVQSQDNILGGTGGILTPTSMPQHAVGNNFVVTSYPFNDPSIQAYAKIVVYQHTDSILVVVDSLLSEPCPKVCFASDNFYGTVGLMSNDYSRSFIAHWNGSTFQDRESIGGVDDIAVTASPFRNRLIYSFHHTSPGDLELQMKADLITSDHMRRTIMLDSLGMGSGPQDPRIGVNYGGWNLFFNEWGTQLSAPTYMRLRACILRGDSIYAETIDSLYSTSGGTARYWQSGDNFVASQYIPYDIAHGEPTDSIRIAVYAVGPDVSGRPKYEGSPYDYVVARKTICDGMGDTSTISYEYENGIFDESFTTARYNIVSVLHPGANGKTISYYYNDLGTGSAEEFRPANHFEELDGTTYKVREYNSVNAIVKESNYIWSADAIDSLSGVFFKKMLKDSTIIDGVSKVTSYEYANPLHLQVTKITESTSSPTIQRVTSLKYPLDYSTPSSTDTMVCALDSMKAAKRVVNAVIEKRVFMKAGTDTTSVLSAELTKYKADDLGRVLPYQTFSLRDSAVTDFTTSGSSTGTFLCDSRYQPVSTVDTYDSKGHPLQVADANGVRSTMLWGYNRSLPIAAIANARTSQQSVGSECSYVGFESGTTNPSVSSDEDYWLLQPDKNLTSTDAHTGSYSQKLPGWDMTSYSSYPLYGPTRDFCPPDLAGQNRTYVVSCWVKTESGMSDGAARLVAMTKINSDTNNDLYPDTTGIGAFQSDSTGDTYGGWVQLQVKLNLGEVRQLGEVSANQLLRIRVFTENHDATHYMLVDDIRVYPTDGTVKSTTTYDPLSLLPTSESDASGVFTSTSYDGFGRPVEIRDSKGSLLKEYSYYFSRDHHDGSFYASDPNYVQEKTYRASGDSTTLKTYSDGLGREIQKELFFGNDDIISHTAYDSLSRPAFVYKPYRFGLGASKHTYDASYGTHVTGYYYDSLGIQLGGTPFAQTRYCADPLNRIQAQGAPGDSFAVGAGHDRRMSYYGDQTNHWYVTESVDEQGNTTKISKDLFGNTAKSQVLNGSTPWLDTYFEYDVLGNLKKSTPPLGETHSTSYKYTTRSELRQKSTPDAGTVKYLYDGNGNLRFSMDGVQSGGNKFAYRIYDKVNRLVQMGEHTPATDFTQVYADGALPTSGNTMHSLMIYDSTVSSDQRNLRGHLSLSKAYRQGSHVSSTTYSYDDFGRTEWIEQTQVGFSPVRVEYSYDRQGDLVKKGFLDLGNINNRLYTYYEYDFAGRISTVYTSPIDDEAGKTLAAHFTYTASSQVRQLSLGDLPAQTVDFAYNERDWLRRINDVGNPGSDRFAEGILYNTSKTGLSTTAQYNGNIAAVELYNGGFDDGETAGWGAYAYTYDRANRLTAAQHYAYPNYAYSAQNAYSLPTISYDGNGNITHLTRRGRTGSISDDFSYRYSVGNRLDSVSTAQTHMAYRYDSNGNVVSDSLRGIASATYDYRNLPISLTKSGGGSISYSYDGSGNRIRKTVGSLDECYILGADGQTEAVYNADGLLFWNIIAGGKVIGKLVP
jgi:YD repeat-containing protein